MTITISKRACRFCKTELKQSFADLGVTPLSNAYIRPKRAHEMEPSYPLHAFVCESCYLVQLEEFESPQKIFNDYAYFSSFSESWLKHCEKFAGEMTERLELSKHSKVVELASNDGYLLQYFRKSGIPVLGVEPAENVARVAIDKGIPTEVVFFGVETARELLADGHAADLLVGNNVLAHVPDLNGFVKGMKILLKPKGVITMEFPHLLSLMKDNQFDTIYHEHFSYFSLLTAEKIFAHHGLTLFAVDRLSTHGGSLRIYGCHSGDGAFPVQEGIAQVKELERAAGLGEMASYLRFADQVRRTKRELLKFLIQAKDEGKTVVGYGAPAKGNTLLNYCGIGPDFIDFTVDRNPHKQGLFLPGSRIPVKAPEAIAQARPDYVLILPWNLREEITAQNSMIRSWGGKFVVPIPQVEIF